MHKAHLNEAYKEKPAIDIQNGENKKKLLMSQSTANVHCSLRER